MTQPRRKKDKLPKDVRHMTGEQVMEKLFSKHDARHVSFAKAFAGLLSMACLVGEAQRIAQPPLHPPLEVL